MSWPRGDPEQDTLLSILLFYTQLENAFPAEKAVSTVVQGLGLKVRLKIRFSKAA